jgi:hypothetical protein
MGRTEQADFLGVGRGEGGYGSISVRYAVLGHLHAAFMTDFGSTFKYW